MRVLVVGLGGIGQRHVRNLRALLGDKVEILAQRTGWRGHVLTDRLAIKPGADLEDEYNIRAFSNLGEALSERPDAVFVANPSSLHVPVALAAADAGCHLFIEKPLSHTYDGVEDLITRVERQGLVALVAYQMRFHPCLQLMRSLLQDRAVGRIISVRADVGEYLPGFHTYEDYRQMYASRSELGGGVILSQIHEMDYIYWLFGLPRRVFALGGHLSSLDIDVEDTASILMECIVDGRPIPVHVHQDYVQRPPSRTCQVIGDAGKIMLDFHGLTVKLYDGDGQLVQTDSFEAFQRNQMYLDDLAHFLGCIRGEQEVMVSVRDGAQSLRMALAAKESIETRKAVDLR